MKIGELANQSGVPAKTIRFYEEIGLLPQAEREHNGYRSYDEGALQQLLFVRHAQAAGLTLREVAQVLAIRSDGRPPCVHVTGLLQQHLAQVETRLAELNATRDELTELISYAERVDPASCPEDMICSILVPRE
ncbi:MAG: heavy metal-responsive transcriptional regulator [Actinomycetota bacterium]|jgi:DNA-binding transcriptional MerR regulator|nr:heavy metal-responsive transcriptional regulator [Actinomycetota bacterium]